MIYLTTLLWSLWYAVAIFALGLPLYFLASPDPIPSWVTLGSAALVAAFAAIYHAVDEITAKRRAREWMNRPSRYG